MSAPKCGSLMRAVWALLFLFSAIGLWPILAALELIDVVGGLAGDTLNWIDRCWLRDYFSFMRRRIKPPTVKTGDEGGEA